MLPVPADHGRRRSDLAAYEAYGYDDVTVDGIVHHEFGVEDQAGRVEVIRGRFPSPGTDGPRGPVPVRLSHRAPDLPIERAAELVRGVFFHFFTNHYWCEGLGLLRVTGDDGASCELPYDRC